MSEKTRVVVLYGGKSTEHDISCRSATFVLKNLDPKKYEIYAIAIDKKGNWLSQDSAKLIENLKNTVPVDKYRLKEDLVTLSVDPSPADFFRLTQISAKSEERSRNDKKRQKTVFFPVLHGTYGEDGAMQGFFSLGNVAFVGSGILGSAVGMDKGIAKKLVKAAGISVVPWLETKTQFYRLDPKAFLLKAEKKLGFPIFVKPACLGSSVGISRAENSKELENACELALSYADKILLEQAMDVREIECAVLGDYDPEVSEPGEVITHSEFYTYEAKYLNKDQATIKVPADLTSQQVSTAKSMTKKIFQELELNGMARVDLFLEKNTGEFFFNEVNTIPGFTETSQYPILWENAGKPPAKLLDRLIDLAIQRQELEDSLDRTFSK